MGREEGRYEDCNWCFLKTEQVKGNRDILALYPSACCLSDAMNCTRYHRSMVVAVSDHQYAGGCDILDQVWGTLRGLVAQASPCSGKHSTAVTVSLVSPAGGW